MTYELLTLLMMNFPVNRNDYVICTFDKELTASSKVYVLAPTRDPNLPTCAGNSREIGVIGPVMWKLDAAVKEGITRSKAAEEWIKNKNDED